MISHSTLLHLNLRRDSAVVTLLARVQDQGRTVECRPHRAALQVLQARVHHLRRALVDLRPHRRAWTAATVGVRRPTARAT